MLAYKTWNRIFVVKASVPVETTLAARLWITATEVIVFAELRHLVTAYLTMNTVGTPVFDIDLNVELNYFVWASAV